MDTDRAMFRPFGTYLHTSPSELPALPLTEINMVRKLLAVLAAPSHSHAPDATLVAVQLHRAAPAPLPLLPPFLTLAGRPNCDLASLLVHPLHAPSPADIAPRSLQPESPLAALIADLYFQRGSSLSHLRSTLASAASLPCTPARVVEEVLTTRARRPPPTRRRRCRSFASSSRRYILRRGCG